MWGEIGLLDSSGTCQGQQEQRALLRLIMDRPQVRTVATLGLTQTLAWASSYYLPAMVAGPMARELGTTVPTVFLAFSAALVVSALLGPVAGRAIDRMGGRVVLMGTNLLFAAGLGLMALATGTVTLFAAWLLMGIAMGSGLYDAAFATLVRIYRHRAGTAITGITLIAGFASTVGWPLSSLWVEHFGWRGACWGWWALHLVVGLPLNWSLPDRAVGQQDAELPTPRTAAPARETEDQERSKMVSIILAFAFAVTWFISTAMAAHLPDLLRAGGASLGTAVAVGALVGPSQVAGRLLEFGFLRRVHPLLSARLAAALHPVGAVSLAMLGIAVAPVFAILHGAGNGILTIAKGTLPLVFFGPQGYGERQGVLMVPARIAQALSPWLFGLLLDRLGLGAMWVSAGLGLAALTGLLMLPDDKLYDESRVSPSTTS